MKQFPSDVVEVLLRALTRDDSTVEEMAARIELRSIIAALQHPSAPALPDDAEAVVACLGDDAAEMLGENPEDERALNMQRAAEIIDARMTSLTFRPITDEDVKGAILAYLRSNSDNTDGYCVDTMFGMRRREYLRDMRAALEFILPHGVLAVGGVE